MLQKMMAAQLLVVIEWTEQHVQNIYSIFVTSYGFLAITLKTNFPSEYIGTSGRLFTPAILDKTLAQSERFCCRETLG